MDLKIVNKKKKLDIKNVDGSLLVVVDVSAVMRSNYVKLEPAKLLVGDKYYLLNEETNELMVDSFGNNIEYRIPEYKNKYAKKELSWPVNGKRFNTSSMYGIFKLFTSFGFDKDYVFCFDSAYNLRKDENPDYKAGRTKAESDYFTQLAEVKAILENVGYSCLAVDGYEGDDLAVECVNQNKKFYDNVVMVSNDYDLSQVIDTNVHFKHCLSNLDDITMENFVEKLKCPYNSILLYKALVGDNSDKIKGVKGFGPKSFEKFVDNENIYGMMGEVRKNNLEKKIIQESVTLKPEQKEEALKALWLVSPKVPKVFVDYFPKKSLRFDLFSVYLSKYGMKSILKEMPDGDLI